MMMVMMMMMMPRSNSFPFYFFVSLTSAFNLARFCDFVKLKIIQILLRTVLG